MSKNNNYIKGKRSDSSSRYIGVCFVVERHVWRARFTLKGKSYHIGCYKSEIDAAHAYNKKASEIMDEFGIVLSLNKFDIPIENIDTSENIYKYKINNVVDDLEFEVWSVINLNNIDYTGFYEVSNMGRVKSLKRVIKTKQGNNLSIYEKLLIPYLNGKEYLMLKLSKDGKQKRALVHRLVAFAFIPNPENKPQVNHKKGIKTDNRASELEWSTALENTTHYFEELGGKCSLTGSKNEHIRKPVIQFDKNTLEELGRFESASEAGRILGFPVKGTGNIGRVCSGERKTYKGFIWKFE